MFITGIIQAIVLASVTFTLGVEVPSITTLALCLAGGIASFAATFFYFKALSKEEVSRVIPVLYLIPIWTMVFAMLFLGELLSMQQVLGIFALVFGAILISIKRIEMKWRISLTLGLVALASILYAIEDVLLKYATGHLNFWNTSFWATLGFAFCSTMLFVAKRKEIVRAINGAKRAALLSSIGEVFASFGLLSMLWSFSLYFVSLSTAVSSVQPLFVLVYSAILGIFWPKILQEELKASALALKGMAILLMTAGSILVL